MDSARPEAREMPMNPAIVALVAVFAVPPDNAPNPPIPDVEVVEIADFETAREPTILEVAADELLRPDGLRVRWASTTYELSSGQEAELFVEVDELGRGDGLIYVDGEALVHVIVDGGTTTWVAPDVDLPPQTLAQLAHANVANEIFSGIGGPQEFPCSDFGKKAVKAAKYLWVGLLGAAIPVWCAATGGVGCPACGAAAAVGSLAGVEAADGYCD
jgi:hypothetical protein